MDGLALVGDWHSSMTGGAWWKQELRLGFAEGNIGIFGMHVETRQQARVAAQH